MNTKRSIKKVYYSFLILLLIWTVGFIVIPLYNALDFRNKTIFENFDAIKPYIFVFVLVVIAILWLWHYRHGLEELDTLDRDSRRRFWIYITVAFAGILSSIGPIQTNWLNYIADKDTIKFIVSISPNIFELLLLLFVAFVIDYSITSKALIDKHNDTLIKIFIDPESKANEILERIKALDHVLSKAQKDIVDATNILNANTKILEPINKLQLAPNQTLKLYELIPIYTLSWANFLYTYKECDFFLLKIMEKYISEEKIDLEGRHLYGSRGSRIPRLSTSLDIYLEILDTVANEYVNLQIQKNRRANIWAITNALPEFWYNWPHLGGKHFVNQKVDRYRRTIERLIKDYSEHVFMKRWLLVDQQDDDKIIPETYSLNELRTQFNKYIYWFDSDEIAPINYSTFQQIAINKDGKKNFPELEFNVDPSKDFYLISTANLAETIIKDSTNHTRKIFRHNLLEYFISSLHSKPEHSYVLISSVAQRWPTLDPEILLFGNSSRDEKDANIDWEFCLSANLNIKHDALVIYMYMNKSLEIFKRLLKDIHISQYELSKLPSLKI